MIFLNVVNVLSSQLSSFQFYNRQDDEFLLLFFFLMMREKLFMI